MTAMFFFWKSGEDVCEGFFKKMAQTLNILSKHETLTAKRQRIPCSFTESLGTEEYVVEHVVAGGGPITT